MTDLLQIILLGILAGADNVQVAAAVSMAPLTRARRAWFALAFCVCEIATPLIGLLIMRSVHTRFAAWVDRLAPAILVACGIAIVFLALKDRDELERIINHRWTIAALPLSLSFDNLLIGVSLGTFGYPLPLAAATIGIISATMCLFGILGGARIRRWIPERANVVSGLYLIVIAAVMWAGDR
ncbi:MAG: manganese efflux pump MntP family protein [Thermoanaerobaculia bacterium]